jgi:hypothetical protein
MHGISGSCGNVDSISYGTNCAVRGANPSTHPKPPVIRASKPYPSRPVIEPLTESFELEDMETRLARLRKPIRSF